MKFQNPKISFSFIFPKEMDMESTSGRCGCAASDSRQRKEREENLHLPCKSQARQAWTAQPYYFPILAAHQSTDSPAEPVLAVQQHEKSLGHHNHGAAPQQYTGFFVISVICSFKAKAVLLLPLKNLKKNPNPELI